MPVSGLFRERRPRSPQTALIALAILAATLPSGCVHRRLTIRSNPPGALVYLDGRELGYTPVATDFTHYGTREIRMVKDGYETATLLQPVRAPWYQRFPFDLISDNFLFSHVQDRHEFSYQLQPKNPLVNSQGLIDRGNAFRSEDQLGPWAGRAGTQRRFLP